MVVWTHHTTENGIYIVKDDDWVRGREAAREKAREMSKRKKVFRERVNEGSQGT